MPIAYDTTRKSLYRPGEAEDFFKLCKTDTDAALCAEMSRLAYVKEKARLKTFLEQAHFEEPWDYGYEQPDTQLFVATHTTIPLTVVAFRGTEPDDLFDMKRDSEFLKTKWFDNQGNPMGHVHQGFADAFHEESGFESQLLARVRQLPAGHRVLITGHSLGAALATLAATRIPKAELFTFGSPLVGDEEFATSIAAIPHQRYVDCCDLVTQVPPEGMGYRHVGTLRYIDRDGHLLASPNAVKIQIDRFQAEAWYQIHHSVFYGIAAMKTLFGTVALRALADHAPINYLSGVTGTRI